MILASNLYIDSIYLYYKCAYLTKIHFIHGFFFKELIDTFFKINKEVKQHIECLIYFTKFKMSF